MPKYLLIIALFFTINSSANAQCSLCTKTAGQLGEKPAKSLNKGILYLAFAPLSIGGLLWFLHKKYGTGQNEAIENEV